MEVKKVHSDKAEIILSKDEAAHLAALAIKHSDNEELRIKLETTFAVMEFVKDEHVSEQAEAAPVINGSRYNASMNDEARRMSASRKAGKAQGWRRPRYYR